MRKLSKEFGISSRDELVELCDQITQIIINHMSKDSSFKKRPIIIGIKGDKNVGKSIFWDGIREQLLEYGGIFVATKSESYQTDNLLGYVREKIIRRFENWVGTPREKSISATKLRLFFANLDLLFHGYKRENMAIVYNADQAMEGDLKALSQLGDIVIFTNSNNARAVNINYDLIIDLQHKNQDINPWKEENWNLNVNLQATSELFIPIVN